MVKGLTEIEVITLFVEDLAACTRFYTTVFELEAVYTWEIAQVIG